MMKWISRSALLLLLSVATSNAATVWNPAGNGIIPPAAGNWAGRVCDDIANSITSDGKALYLRVKIHYPAPGW